MFKSLKITDFIFAALFIVFLAFKLAGKGLVAGWNWYIVFCPLVALFFGEWLLINGAILFFAAISFVANPRKYIADFKKYQQHVKRVKKENERLSHSGLEQRIRDMRKQNSQKQQQ